MNKAKTGAIGGGIAAVVIIGIIVSVLASENYVSSDNPEITEDVILDQTGPEGDSVAINESYSVNKGVDFYINEDGKKTYVIKASDSPDLGE